MTDKKYEILMSPAGRYLYVHGTLPTTFHGEKDGDGYRCPLDAQNAASIRHELPWSAPQPVGMRKSVGCGDRLGIATPGHLRAVREGDMFPVLAQQSIREMQRAGRSAQAVMDDATWGVIQADYREGWGCDADHLKDIESVDACVAAGYIGFTLDPGAFVDDEANDAPIEILRHKVAALPWDILSTDLVANHLRYSGEMTETQYLRAAAKYGKALAHVVTLSRRIEALLAGKTFDLEISVDETASVTTLAEHRYIVGELRRLQVPFTGIAPRFVGAFEKGVDYIGNLALFEASYREHAALATELGPYKLSIHSGSDKFSIYPIAARYSNTFVHLKTAGTSWLEALRVIAAAEPDTFRRILKLAMDGYETNRTSYHVSGKVENIPTQMRDGLLDQFDARQVLHVAFGALLSQFREDIYHILYANFERYCEVLHAHFRKHIQPFKEVERQAL